MEWQQLITDGYGRLLEILDRTLDGLTEDDLNMRPHPDCNSMGWLAWHLTRELDFNIADLMGEEQLWISDGWYARFNREPKPLDTGFAKFGHTDEDVAAFKSPDVETLLEYYRAALERAERYVNTLSAADLDKVLDTPSWSWEKQRRITDAGVEEWYKPVPTVGRRLVSVLSECLQHAGQVAYVRGLLKGKGWLGV